MSDEGNPLFSDQCDGKHRFETRGDGKHCAVCGFTYAGHMLLAPDPDGITDYAPLTPEQRRAWLNDPNHIVLHDPEADRDD